MNSVRVKAYAKLNLSLDVTGSESGYHLIDSVVTTVDIFDTVTVKKRKKDKLVSIFMRGMGSENIPFERNNAVSAAEKFISAYGTCGADIIISKNIPMGAGLGGSSADVAGVLNAMKRLFEIDDEEGIKAIADGIGSDCGYLLGGGYARIRGRGQEVMPLDSSMRLDFVLLLPDTPVSTAECYKKYDCINVKNKPSSGSAEKAVLDCDRPALGAALSNALLAPALTLNPSVGEAVMELKQFAPLGVSMTGSGSAVFALFENEEMCRYAVSRYRGKFKVLHTKTVNYPYGKPNPDRN